MATPASAVQTRPTWKLYLELTKPRVVALIVFTAIVGTLLASPGWPPLDALIWGNLGIAVVGLAIMLALARFLHARQIFLRV